MTTTLHPEYERKWLLQRLPEVSFQRCLHIRQGYIEQNQVWVRIRETVFPDTSVQCVLCRKIPITGGNMEWEVPISRDAFEMLWFLCTGSSLVKTRYEFLDGAGFRWEIDVFEGDLDGFVIMELELPDPNTKVIIPDVLAACIEREVTGDPTWSNRMLARRLHAHS